MSFANPASSPKVSFKHFPVSSRASPSLVSKLLFPCALRLHRGGHLPRTTLRECTPPSSRRALVPSPRPTFSAYESCATTSFSHLVLLHTAVLLEVPPSLIHAKGSAVKRSDLLRPLASATVTVTEYGHVTPALAVASSRNAQRTQEDQPVSLCSCFIGACVERVCVCVWCVWCVCVRLQLKSFRGFEALLSRPIERLLPTKV